MPYDINKVPDGLKGGSAGGARAVTPHDTTDLDPYAEGVFVGNAGTVTVLPVTNYFEGLTTGVLFTVPAGFILPLQVARVFTTGTTSTNIVALDE